MKLQARDTEIIQYLDEFKGATITQIGTLFFKGSYEATKKRLNKLEKEKLIKGTLHSILGKKVYYINKLPSFHRLIANEIRIMLQQHVQILDFKFEAKIDTYKTDALAVYKNNKVHILILEIDIFNRTKDEKLKQMREIIKNKTGVDPILIVISKHRRRAGKGDRVINIEIEKISSLLQYL